VTLESSSNTFKDSLVILKNDLLSGARHYWGELVVIASIMIILGILMVPFRRGRLPSGTQSYILIALALILVLAWILKSKPIVDPDSPQSPRFVVTKADLLPCAFLAIATVVLFYLPMRLHFDTGTDLSVMFGVDRFWFPPWALLNRPLVGIGPYMAMKLFPASLDGFIVILLVSRFLTAMLLYFIVRLLLPQGSLTAFIAGLLFLINPGEGSRFYLWSIIYQTELLFFILAVWLFLKSYLNHSRGVLVLSCIALAICFFHYEHAYPLAATAPLLLLLLTPLRKQLIVWLAAWLGIVTIFTARLANYLLFVPNTYQLGLFKYHAVIPDSLFGWLWMMLANLGIQTAPLFRFVTSPQSLLSNWTIGVLVFVGILAAIWKTKFLPWEGTRPRKYFLGMLTGVTVAILGVIVYIPLPITTGVPDYGTNPTLRYQFFAGPGQAIAWAMAIGFLGAAISRHHARWAFLTVCIATALICALATTGAYDYQKKGGVLNPYYRYSTAASVLRHIDQTLPKLDEQVCSAIFLELPDNEPSPMGWNYTLFHWSCVLFKIPSFQGRITADGKYQQRIFGYPDGKYLPAPSYRRLYHYRTTADGKTEFIGTTDIPGPEKLKCKSCILRPYSRQPGAPPPFISNQARLVEY
jgi:hypothetical protein